MIHTEEATGSTRYRKPRVHSVDRAKKGSNLHVLSAAFLTLPAAQILVDDVLL